MVQPRPVPLVWKCYAKSFRKLPFVFLMPSLSLEARFSRSNGFHEWGGNDIFRHDRMYNWTTELGLHQGQYKSLKWQLLFLLSHSFWWKYVLLFSFFNLSCCFSIAKVRSSNLLFNSFCFQSNFLLSHFKEFFIALILTLTSCYLDWWLHSKNISMLNLYETLIK